MGMFCCVRDCGEDLREGDIVERVFPKLRGIKWAGGYVDVNLCTCFFHLVPIP